MQVIVSLPGALREHAGGRARVPVELAAPVTLGGLLDQLADDLPALERRVRDETGALRRHVNVFVDEADVRYTGGLDTVLEPDADVTVLPAVSGG